MARGLYLLFSALAYCIFFATFLYLIAFVGNFPGVPRTVDRGPITDLVPAFMADFALITLFGLQHSIMARQGFKRAWTRIIPEPIERSIYVLLASLVLTLLFALWRPIGGTVWSVENPTATAMIWSLFALGWLIVLLSTFLINHFELFGLKQVYLHLRGGVPAEPKFRTPFFYRLVRHPLYLGFFIAFWAAPVMSVGHLVLAIGMSIYMLIAIQFEERDLVRLFGDDYERYRHHVGMLLPSLRKRAE